MLAIMFMDLLDDPADEPRFTRMCEHYQNYIYTICFSRLHDVQLAEDCTWLTFEQAAKQFRSFDEDIHSKSVRNLLVTIAIAKCNREWTKQNKFHQIREKLGQIGDEVTSALEDAVFQKFEVENLQKAIDDLPELYRLPLFLSKIYGFSTKEVAEICEISPEAARKRISLAKKKLLEQLEGGVDNGE